MNCALSAEELDMCETDEPLTGEYIARCARHNVDPVLQQVVVIIIITSRNGSTCVELVEDCKKQLLYTFYVRIKSSHNKENRMAIIISTHHV